jgi:hypothetical protein
MARASATPALSDEQLPELLRLLEDADSAELKLTVPESGQYTAAAALGLDPLDAEIRQVYFFDTPDLTLNRHGVVLRVRRVQRKGGDSVVKLRPVIPKEVPKTLRKTDAGGLRLFRNAEAERRKRGSETGRHRDPRGR